MAIDGINQATLEQIMSLTSSSITNSSSSSSTSNEMNYAFQLLMQSYLNQSSSSTTEDSTNVEKVISTDSNNIDTSTVSKIIDVSNSDESNGATEDILSSLMNMYTSKLIQQSYLSSLE